MEALDPPPPLYPQGEGLMYRDAELFRHFDRLLAEIRAGLIIK